MISKQSESLILATILDTATVLMHVQDPEVVHRLG